MEARLYFPEFSIFSEYLFQDNTRSSSVNSSFGNFSGSIIVSLDLNSWFFIVFILLRERPEFPLIFISNFGFSTLTFVGTGIGLMILVSLKYSKGIILKLVFFFDLLMLMIRAASLSILLIVFDLY